MMEKIDKCIFCGCESLEELLTAPDFMVTDEVFSVVRCLSCQFVFTNPRPEPINTAKYYKSDNYISHNDDSKDVVSVIYRFVRRFMLFRKSVLIIKQLNNKGKSRLLDYGCGTGEFLKQAQKSGLDSYGFEPDEDARNLALEKGLKVTSASHEVSDLVRDGSTFHAITLWHVLEHIPDLHEKLAFFRSLIDDNGVIVVAVPEYKSFDASFYGKYWAAWDLPRHINHFSKRSLINWFSEYGFQLKSTSSMWFDSFYISILSEKYKGSGWVGLFRAFMVAAWSNILSIFTSRPASSEIYIFRPK